MGKRSTVYHRIVSPEKWENVSQQNKDLLNEFLNYLRSANKSPATIVQYEAQLRTFFVFVYERCNNTFFIYSQIMCCIRIVASKNFVHVNCSFANIFITIFDWRKCSLHNH